jgi:glucose-1-phosphate adenylyltransferase
VKKEIIAMLLAGGQGSRLGVLTKNIAKPAVLYGGKYRIIDFSLSNCINSGIDTIGVLTQYLPFALNTHIGIGKPWDLDRASGGVTILSPYMTTNTSEWYKGTANAIYQNTHYIDRFNPQYVIILSGDHIYKMDYSLMLEFHKEKKADATISVIEVPYEEASRFGIMNTCQDGKIYEFEEKPKNPKSNLASMGVYIFNWEILKEFLYKDNLDEYSNNDFGKNIIPSMLKSGMNMWAYKFGGYWKDVGTIHAYWESNMNLISRIPDFNLFDSAWRTFTRNPVMPSHFISATGCVKKSIIAEGVQVYGSVKNSVIFPGVSIGKDCDIEDSIVMTNCSIGENSIIRKSIICENAVLGSNIKMGFGDEIVNECYPEIYNSGISVVGDHAIVPDFVELGKNVFVDSHASSCDFATLKVRSGKSIIKGCENL